MNTNACAPVLFTIFNELISGSADPSCPTYVLNQGDPGLLASLDRLSATAASAIHQASSIAAHVDHLRYGLAALNEWAQGTLPADKDWTASWQKNVVSENDWRALREELRREAHAWADALRTPREVSDTEAAWLAASVVHLAYHVGAIRQMDRITRGPTADDEARAQGKLRSA
jgi:hypothetical protein